MTAAMVIPGAESFFLPGNSIGILICHGFNGTPQSVRYLGEKFAAKGLYCLRSSTGRPRNG